MDLLVTVPKNLWFGWIDEGDAVAEPATGVEWGFWLSRAKPPIEPGERLYVCAWGLLRGYAPVTRVVLHEETGRWVICREGNAVACTIPRAVEGFQGYRKRTWEHAEEVPFPDWKVRGLPAKVIGKAICDGLLEKPRATP